MAVVGRRRLQFGLKTLLVVILLVAAFFGGRAWTDREFFTRLAAERDARDRAEQAARAEERMRFRSDGELLRLYGGLIEELQKVQRPELRDGLKPFVDVLNEFASVTQRRDWGMMALMGVIEDCDPADKVKVFDIDVKRYDDLAEWFDQLEETAKATMTKEARQHPPRGGGLVVTLKTQPKQSRVPQSDELPEEIRAYLDNLNQIVAKMRLSVGVESETPPLSHAAAWARTDQVPARLRGKVPITYHIEFVWNPPAAPLPAQPRPAPSQ